MWINWLFALRLFLIRRVSSFLGSRHHLSWLDQRQSSSKKFHPGYVYEASKRAKMFTTTASIFSHWMEWITEIIQLLSVSVDLKNINHFNFVAQVPFHQKSPDQRQKVNQTATSDNPVLPRCVPGSTINSWPTDPIDSHPHSTCQFKRIRVTPAKVSGFVYLQFLSKRKLTVARLNDHTNVTIRVELIGSSMADWIRKLTIFDYVK